MYAAVSEAFWAGLAAILTGVAGIIYAWASVIKAKHEAEEECELTLKSLRDENELYASQLHAVHMQFPITPPPL